MAETLYGFKKVPQLSKGAHLTPQEGMCVMELVSFINGDRDIIDVPECTHYKIAVYMQCVNDSSSDGDRVHLLSVLDRMFHTGSMSWEQRHRFSDELISRSTGFMALVGDYWGYRVYFDLPSRTFPTPGDFWKFAHELAAREEESIKVKLDVLNLILDCADAAMGVEETLPQNREVIVEMLEKSGVELVEV